MNTAVTLGGLLYWGLFALSLVWAAYGALWFAAQAMSDASPDPDAGRPWWLLAAFGLPVVLFTAWWFI